MKGKFFRINENIKADTVRLVGDTGSDVLSSNEALKRAKEEGQDLVEIVPEAKPPVVKIIDFKKFLFEEKRKETEAKKKARVKKQDTKELRMGPFISDNDLEFRIRRAKEFMEAGDKVKITVEFKGREITRKEFGQDKMNRFLQGVAAQSETEWGPEQKGRFLSAMVKPKK